MSAWKKKKTLEDKNRSLAFDTGGDIRAKRVCDLWTDGQTITRPDQFETLVSPSSNRTGFDVGVHSRKRILSTNKHHDNMKENLIHGLYQEH